MDPVLSITVYFLLYAFGKAVSKKTKGVFVEALFLSLVYIVCFMSGLFPEDTLNSTSVPALMSTFGLMLMVTNLGTMIDLKRFVREWKTVIICFVGLAVMAVLFLIVGQMLFGRWYALSALPPVAGGLVANTMVTSAAESAGHPEIGAFASLVCSLQTFFSVPVASFLLRKHCEEVIQTKNYDVTYEDAQHSEKKAFLSDSVPMIEVGKLCLVMYLGMKLSSLTGGVLPSAVSVMLLGIVFTEVNFLDRNTLQKAGFMPFLLACMVMILPNSFRTLTFDSFTAMLLPAACFLVLGVVGLMLGGALVSRVFKVDWKLGAAVSLSAMFGYPLTEIIVHDVCEGFNLENEEEEKLMNTVLPQMIIAGFATVTVASVVLAGVVAQLIFA